MSGRGVTLTPHPVYCRGQERVELYLYSPCGPYGLYRALVPVQGALYLPFTHTHTQIYIYIYKLLILAFSGYIPENEDEVFQ